MFSSRLWVPVEAGGPVPSPASVIGRRGGRIAFGTALLVGMAVVVYGAIIGPGAWSWLGGPFTHDLMHGRTHSIPLLAATWLLALVAYGATRLIVRAAAPAPRGDAMLRASLVVPAVGIAFTVPLSIHAVAFALVGEDFGGWICASCAAVGLAHVVFAVTFGIRAGQLARGEPRMTVPRIYKWSVIASLVPCGMFLLPEILTAVTGLFVVPVMERFDAIALHEREALPVLPIARVL